MRLESAFIASQEGLMSQGQAISVVSDNIANSDTTGFKTSRSEFSDLVPAGNGGLYNDVNQGSVGSGSQVQTVRVIHQAGDLEDTGRSLDIAIQGDGFFTVGDPAAPVYTRAGNFEIDQTGLLVTGDGQPVLGYVGAATTGALTSINLKNVAVTVTPTTTAALTGNISSVSPITTVPTPTSFNQITASASAIQSVTVYDSQGASHNVTIGFFRTANNTWTTQAYVDGGDVGGTAGVPTLVGQGTLAFQPDGTIADANKATSLITASIPFSNGAAAGNISIDLSGFTQYASQNSSTSVTQNGQSGGSVDGYEFQANGDIYAVLSSGSSVKVGSLQLAQFANVDGLERVGGNTFRATEASGAATTGAPQAAGAGSLKGGALERSTVDISKEFVNLIVIQRGYQANSQMLTTANNILKDTIAMLK